MSRIILRCFLMSVTILLTAHAAAAQAPSSDSTPNLFSGGRASTTLIIGPGEIQAATIGYRYASAPATAPRRAFSRAETLMIVGGAALVAGLVVGDDAGTVLILAGAGIGGYGLYLFLQSPDTR